MANLIFKDKTTRGQLIAWESMVSQKYIDDSSVRKEIAVSWNRCLQNEIDPINSKNSILAPNYLDRSIYSKRLLKAAKPYLAKLYDSLKGLGVIIILADCDGTIIYSLGDKKMDALAESLALIPGASCSENTIGTTSPGVCLLSKMPSQVSTLEHYCQLYHNWNCTAVPLLDHNGQFLGTLDLSYTNKELHNKVTLGLLEATAQSIKLELKYLSMHHHSRYSSIYINNLFNSLSEPLLYFESNGVLAHLNMSAANILCASPQYIIGEQISNLIEGIDSIDSAMRYTMSWKELNYITTKGSIKVDSLIRPVNNDESNVGGVIVSLRKITNNKNTAKYYFSDYIHNSTLIDMLIEKAQRISLNETTAMLEGESGTGKELIAQSIHNNSSRKRGPFIVVNCAALPKELIQSELFGYEDGTFTGAKKGGKPGKFELANGGTIFLDEIGDMPFDAQANLLRVLQEKSVVRVGGSVPISLDVRVIAATNRNLGADVESGRFRHDLYYRLSVVTLTIPPLRERREDIEVLIQHFIKKHACLAKSYRDIVIDNRALVALKKYEWPGNIRELENTVIFLLHNISNAIVSIIDLPNTIIKSHHDRNNGNSKLIKTLAELEKEAISDALVECDNNISRAARLLGITRVTLYKKIKGGDKIGT